MTEADAESTAGAGAAEPTITVLVVDDHPIVRQGLRAFLSGRAGIDVVGEAADGDAAVTEAARLRPDVVVMDLVMPGTDGVSATRRITEANSDVRVLVLTSFSSEDQVMPALQAGAAGYLLKDASPSKVEEAIRTVYGGGSVLDPHVTSMVLARVAEPAAGSEGLAQLTRREREVLGLLGLGLSNRELADRLVVSEKTVKTHVSSVLAKLQLTDRTQAALYAVRHGLVPPPPPSD